MSIHVGHHLRLVSFLLKTLRQFVSKIKLYLHMYRIKMLMLRWQNLVYQYFQDELFIHPM